MSAPHVPYLLFEVDLPLSTFLFSEMRSHFFLLTVRQRFHHWCPRGKIIWHFATVKIQFFPKPLQIFDLRTTPLTNFTQVYPPKTFTVNKYMQKYIYIVSVIVCSSPKTPFVPCPCTVLVQWCFGRLPDQVVVFLWKLLFYWFSCLCSLLLLLYFQRLCFPTTLFEDNLMALFLAASLYPDVQSCQLTPGFPSR